MSGQTWTPAPKRGIIPLHPMTFGMLLGKSFAALRHNPKIVTTVRGVGYRAGAVV